MSLTFDPTSVPTDAWQTLLSSETDTEVYSIKTALYTDDVFSSWAEANPSEDLAEQYSDNTLAMLCSITVYNSVDFITSMTDLDGYYCIVGEKVAWGAGFANGFLPLIVSLGADTTEPAVGDYLVSPEINGYFGFDILNVDSTTYGEYNTSW